MITKKIGLRLIGMFLFVAAVLLLLVAVVGVVVITSKRKREYAYQKRDPLKTLPNPEPSPYQQNPPFLIPTILSNNKFF